MHVLPRTDGCRGEFVDVGGRSDCGLFAGFANGNGCPMFFQWFMVVEWPMAAENGGDGTAALLPPAKRGRKEGHGVSSEKMREWE
ncbi:hypothetical protein HAX54_011427, partial [Datura stramonium]|nr:hypothetical protein [Datura stramonium]